MAWMVVDKEQNETIFQHEPQRDSFGNWEEDTCGGQEQRVELPKGSIEKLIGRKLTWEDDPVKLKDSE